MSKGFVAEVRDVHGPTKDANETNDFGEHVSEFVEFLFQGRVFIFLLFSCVHDLRLNDTDFGIHSGGYYNSNGTSIYDQCTAEQDVNFVQNSNLLSFLYNIDGLVYRVGFSCQGGLVNF